jgi:hypothetical protein
MSRRQVLSGAVLLAASISCGGGGAGPTKTETHTGTFGVIHKVYSLDTFEGAVDATLTWTVPAEGERPIADLRIIIAGLPDRTTASSPRSETPPVTLRGSGSHIIVSCSNCNLVTPAVSFTLTVTGR